MKYRKYDHKKDKKAVFRIWNEVGWASKEDSYSFKTFIPKSRAIVSEVNGEAECLVLSDIGDYFYEGAKLKFSAITGVTTSFVARKQKLALKLTAKKIALDAIDGAEVTGLGIFDQGFYNLLGYGNGSYEHFMTFVPSSLKIQRDIPAPERIGLKQAKEIYKLKVKRYKVHGSVNLSEHCSSGDIHESKGFQGYGFRDKNGDISHMILLFGKGNEHGPFRLDFLYQNYDQFLDLLALIKSFGDQIYLCKITEPAGIQFQDFLDKPFKYRGISEKGKYENKLTASSWWQMRILNLENCISKIKAITNIKFNLKLNDPISKYLDDKSKWKGVSGDYIISLGKKSSAIKGFDKNLMTMEAGVGAFSRLWSGGLKATELSFSDELKAPKKLLSQLDKAICLPKPHFDWEF